MFAGKSTLVSFAVDDELEFVEGIKIYKYLMEILPFRLFFLFQPFPWAGKLMRTSPPFIQILVCKVD